MPSSSDVEPIGLKKQKVVVLLSGGLDSNLSTRLGTESRNRSGGGCSKNPIL